MLRNRLAKIVATLGPASNTTEAIMSLYESGADVFRINAAYADDASNAALISRVREAISDESKPVGTIWDLPGLKMRIGGFLDGRATLVAGSSFTLDQSPDDGDETRVYLPFPEAFAHTRVGDVHCIPTASHVERRARPLPPTRTRPRRHPQRRTE